MLYKLNEHWKGQLAVLKQRSEGNQQERKAQFITAVSQLEKNYHELVQLHTKLAVLDFTIISSNRTALQSFIEQFLSSFATLKEELEQQDCFKTDLEIGWRTTTEARNYFEFFQQHWTQLAMKKVISQLVTEVTAYHNILGDVKVTEQSDFENESIDFSDDLRQLFSTN